MVKAKNRADMSERPFLKKIILFSLPMIATSILQLLYNAADLVVVGQFDGQESLGAVGSTTSLINLIVNLFIGLSVGALSAMSKAIGAKDEKHADSIVHTAIPVSVIGGVAVGLVGFFASKELLILMDASPALLEKSSLYMKIYFIGMPFMTLYNFGASILRACGDTKRPLVILAASGLANVGLNLALVIGCGLGVAGVAIGTSASQFISAIAVVAVLMRRKGYGRLSLKRMRIDKKALTEMTGIGLPAGVQSTIFSISNVIIQSSINSFDNAATAALGLPAGTVVSANTVAANLEGFIYSTLYCISQSCLTFTAHNYGAKKSGNMRLVLFECLALVCVTGLALGAVFSLLANPLIRIYNSDPYVMQYARERLIVLCMTYFLCGSMDTLVGSLRGMGCSLVPMISSIIGVCGIRIMWVYTVFAATDSLMWLYVSYPISWLITCGVHIACYFIMRRKAERKIAAELADCAKVQDGAEICADEAAFSSCESGASDESEPRVSSGEHKTQPVSH